MHPKIVVIIQARMGSSRLPGKTLMNVGGKPILERVIQQVSACKSIHSFVVATSYDLSDNPIAEYCHNRSINLYRGSCHDVLSRYAIAAQQHDANIVVRITGDCPLHSPDTIDDVVYAFIKSSADYVSNTSPYTRPDGQDVEVFSAKALSLAHASATESLDREHVTPWIRRSDTIKKINYLHPGVRYALLRWSVDYLDDLHFADSVWTILEKQNLNFYPFSVILQATTMTSVSQGQSTINEGFYRSFFDVATDEAASPLALNKSNEWLTRSQKVIPGGAQTYSKSWRHHIRGVTPIFLESGSGSCVIDVDGNKYVDLIQGLLPNILGYASPEVDKSAYDRACSGHSFSLPHPVEVLLAEKLCESIPCAEKVRFGKNGSDATAGAVRVARAFTKREHVAVCGYHGWQDWFIGTTSRKDGVPQAVCDLAHPFPYNDIDALQKLLSSKPHQFAAVILEPVNFFWPDPDYLDLVIQTAHSHGALVIFDEICSGFHFGIGGAQKLFNVTPDLATFGKAMGNGWPISCIVGRSDIMQVFEDAFVSFTFAGDVSAMSASLKVFEILEKGDAYASMTSAGTKICDGAKTLADLAGLGYNFHLKGHPHWSFFSFVDDEGKDDPLSRAIWIQEVTRRGVLILTTFNISASLDEQCVHTILSAFAHAFKYLARVKGSDKPLELFLDGQIPVPAFRARG